MKTTANLCLAAALLVAVSQAQAAPCDWSVNYGKVHRIYPQFYPASMTEVPTNAHKPGTFFQLVDGATGALTTGGYYHVSANGTSAVPPTHTRDSLYRSMDNLIVEAAKNNWTVAVRTTNCSVAQNIAPVEYLVVDLP